MSVLPEASEEQQVIVDAIKEGFNVVCNAEAGAGKSTTAYHAATAWLLQNPGGSVLQVCYNVVLRSEAELRVKKLEIHIDCYTIHGLASKVGGKVVSDTLTLKEFLANPSVTLPSNYGMVIIDEVQDLSQDMLDVVTLIHKTLETPPQYLIVGDDRQEIYAYTRTEGVDALKSPETALPCNGRKWKRCPLLRSYRLTVPVCAFINNTMRHPSQPIIEPGNTKSSAKIPIYAVCEFKNSTQLNSLVRQMISLYGAGNIMILAPTVESDMYATHKIAKSLRLIPGLRIYSTHKQRVEVVHEMIAGKLFLSTFHQSKGYERDCVIVLGVDELAWSLGEDRHPDGSYAVSNALHVACTRAKEQLVLVQSARSNPHPAINMQAVHMYSEYRMLSPEQPEERWVKDNPRQKNKEWGWVLKFPKADTLSEIWDAIHVSDLPSRLGPPAPTQPKTSVVIADYLEDVWDYFPTAILSAAEHMLLREREQGNRVRCFVVQMVLMHKNMQDIPPNFRSVWETLVNHDAPEGPKGWLAVAAMYKALVVYNYPHELAYLSSFSWMGHNETEYFTHCVNNILKALRPYMELGHFNDKRLYVCDKHNVRVTNYAQFASYDDETGVGTPWIFCFSDRCTEMALLRATLCMWVYRVNTALIFCVPANTLYTVHANEMDKVDKFIEKLIENRL